MGEIRRSSQETYLANESKRVSVVRGGHVAKHQGQATKRFTKNQTAKSAKDPVGPRASTRTSTGYTPWRLRGETRKTHWYLPWR